MKTTPANLQFLFIGYQTLYQNAYGQYQPVWTEVATLVNSTTSEERYGWMADLPSMREWVGERYIHTLTQYDYVIKNKTWELTLKLDKEEIEDDRYDKRNLTVQMMGQSAALHPDELVANLLETGETVIGFDGQYFFDTDHPQRPGDAASPTYSNYEASGFPLNSTNFNAARTRMRKYKSANGKGLGVKPDILMVPAALESVANSIVNDEYLANGGTNPDKGKARVVVNDRLTDDAAWYLIDGSKPVKPIIYQRRKAPEFAYLDDPTSTNVFYKKEFVFGVDSRDNVGVSLPFLIFKGRA